MPRCWAFRALNASEIETEPKRAQRARTCAPARIVTRDAVVRHCAPEILSTEFDIASRFYSGGSRHALRGFHSLAKVTHLNGDTSPEPFPRCASKKHRAQLRSSTAPRFASFPMAETREPAHQGRRFLTHEDVRRAKRNRQLAYLAESASSASSSKLMRAARETSFSS